MVNTTLFATQRGTHVPDADTTNAAGGKAYKLSAEQALTKLVLTGTLGDTYYTSAGDQLDEVKQLAGSVDVEFLAQLAVYAREQGFMKDTSALLLAILCTRDTELFKRVFNRVVDSGKMLRNFVQILRSGTVGRKSLGSAAKGAVQQWLLKATDAQLLNGAIGTTPSLADVIKMVHPKPTDANRAALFAWIIGREFVQADLPAELQQLQAFRQDSTLEVPKVPFLYLSSQPDFTLQHWEKLVRTMSWTQLRMNLNTLTRKGLFENDNPNRQENIRFVAERLADVDAIQKARIFPYQLLTTYQATLGGVPQAISNALQQAMEVAVSNVPKLPGQTVVGCDVSGSMQSPVTGSRGTKDTSTRCIDVAGLISAAILRKNQEAVVIPFDDGAYDVRDKLNPFDSVMTIASQLASINGGSTQCALVIAGMYQMGVKADLVVIVSDNESWSRGYNSAYYNPGSELDAAWARYLAEVNPNAKLVCLDINPSSNSQVSARPNTLNIGGFTDNVFELIRQFAEGQYTPDFQVEQVKAVTL